MSTEPKTLQKQLERCLRRLSRQTRIGGRIKCARPRMVFVPPSPLTMKNKQRAHMCMIDDAEPVIVLHERHPTAKKEHKCSECHRIISAGERYMVERYVLDGHAETHKTCSHCQVARDWLVGECHGFIYGLIGEDIHDHADGSYGFVVKLLDIGLSRQWKSRDGRLWPVPRMPKTTPYEQARKPE